MFLELPQAERQPRFVLSFFLVCALLFPWVLHQQAFALILQEASGFVSGKSNVQLDLGTAGISTPLLNLLLGVNLTFVTARSSSADVICRV